MRKDGLREEVGALLRARRQAAGLTQDVVARDSGVTQALISRVERGLTQASLDLVEKLFAALGLQLRVSVERLGAHLDTEIERLCLVPASQRLTESQWPWLCQTIGSLDYVIEGPLAALVQGVPLPVDTADIVLTPKDVDAFTDWLRRRGAWRWHERWQEFRMMNPDPRVPGSLHWQVGDAGIRARLNHTLPDWIVVIHDEQPFRVRPLPDLELSDPTLASLLRRYRELASASTDQP